MTSSFIVDVAAYVDIKSAQPLLTPKANLPIYFNGFRIAGHKITTDGSPQGKTAWLGHPYHIAPEGQDSSYVGYPAIEQAALFEGVKKAYEKNIQVIVHANGDAAIGWFIDAVREAQALYGQKDLRPVLIHGQTLRAAQIPALAELNIIASLFTLHTFYWGDWHYESVLGPERAEFISPTRASLDAGVKVTTHTDSPVVLPNPMRMVAATTERKTRSGRILGADQRLNVYESLKAITSTAAYQYFEEDQKGSIAIGKFADFAIVSANPLAVPTDEIADIDVVETIKKDKSVFSLNQTARFIVDDIIGTQKADELIDLIAQ